MELMELNNIQYSALEKDTTFSVESYKIDDFKTRSDTYEGHYPQYDTRVTKITQTIDFSEGDFVIPTDQPGIRYILETLEPMAPDSFFNWNFFDPILQQKEGFSPYVFEDLAATLLKKDADLKEEFLLKRQSDEVFAQNWYAQLEWLYQQSDYAEGAFLQYTVYRLPKP
jgi:hypothetical protein